MSLGSGSSKTFPQKVVKEGEPKITSKNFEKSATKPGKKGVKQFKNKQQGDKIPKNKFQQGNKFNRKRKIQPDSKNDGKHWFLWHSFCSSLAWPVLFSEPLGIGTLEVC